MKLRMVTKILENREILLEDKIRTWIKKEWKKPFVYAYLKRILIVMNISYEFGSQL
jgi:hypothetical protein